MAERLGINSLQVADPEMHALHDAGTDGFSAVDVAVVGLEQRREEARKKPETGEQTAVFVAPRNVRREAARPTQVSSPRVEYFLRTNE